MNNHKKSRVYSFGLVVGNIPESYCIRKKQRLLVVDCTWLITETATWKLIQISNIHLRTQVVFCWFCLAVR